MLNISIHHVRPWECFSNYRDWRRTKTPPRALGSGSKPIILEEIDQATHELVGEIAELSALVMEYGTGLIVPPHEVNVDDERVDLRARFIDEIGDVVFCSYWAAEAWLSLGGLVSADRDRMLADRAVGTDVVTIPNYSDDDGDAEYKESLYARYKAGVDDELSKEVEIFLMASCLTASFRCGLTSNTFKKIRFQARDKDPLGPAALVLQSMNVITSMLPLADATIRDAMKANVEKLDARFPHGWVPGGGNRNAG